MAIVNNILDFLSLITTRSSSSFKTPNPNHQLSIQISLSWVLILFHFQRRFSNAWFVWMFWLAKCFISSMSISLSSVLTSMRWINSTIYLFSFSLSISYFSFSFITVTLSRVNTSYSPVSLFFCDLSCDRRNCCLMISSLLAILRPFISFSCSSVSSSLCSMSILESSITLHFFSSTLSCSSMTWEVSPWFYKACDSFIVISFSASKCLAF